MASAPSERLIEHALTLIVQSEITPHAPADAIPPALNQWCDKSAEHKAAAQEARRRWDALRGMAADLRTHFHETDGQAHIAPSSGNGRQRRKLLLSVAALLGTGVLAGRGIQWYWQQPVFTASYGTRTAQMLKVMLADGENGRTGSRLDLSPQSTLNVALFRQRRTVDMARGEVRFEIARDADRPFIVMTREARIEVIGTVFTVRDRGGTITVGVEQGLVRVQVLQRKDGDIDTTAAPAIDLSPGQALDIHDGRAEAVRQVDAATLSVWRDGWLVFENAALGDALATINAYLIKPITSGDPRVDALRLSGRFRANDSAGLVAALPMILPLSTRTRPDGGVELLPR